jgi:thymidine phosphorylase
VLESVKVLNGESVPDLYEVSINIAGAMIYLGGNAQSLKEGKEKSIELINNGKAMEKFVEITEAQNGDASLLRNPEKYPSSNIVEKVYAAESGYLSEVDNYEIGMSALELGAGRKTKEDSIDPKAGIIFYPKIGDFVESGSLLAEINTDKENIIESSKKQLLSALKFSAEKPEKPEIIKEIVE